MGPKDQLLNSYLPEHRDLWSLVRARSRVLGDRPFLIWQPFEQAAVTITYAELERRVRSVAAGLQARGVKPRDRILVHLGNSPEFIISVLACAATGTTAVTTNTRSSEDELAYYATDCGAVGAITQPKHLATVKAAAPTLRWLACTDHDAGEPAPAPARAESFAALESDPESFRTVELDPFLPLIVQYTSGTTARAKGVVWTHANALWAARINAGHEDLREDDCHYTYLPLFHANAMTFSVLPTLWAGSRLLLIPKWSTSRFWALSLRHRCTFASLIGVSIRSLAGMPAPKDHTYRLFGTGVCLDAFPGIGVKTIGWWGMTETVAPGIVGSTHLPNRAMSIGKPAPQYEIAVVRENGTPVDEEEPGHLMIRGEPGLTLFAEYLNQPDATRACFSKDGWMRTGDLVKRHADGFMTFVDRHKDMLRVGAENVAASEIERVIGTVPGVIEVAVVGRPDPKLDEVPVAFIVARSADGDVEQRVVAACRSMLADFKIPQAIYFVEALPRSTISKINKVELRAVAGADADRAAAVRRWRVSAATDPSGDADQGRA